ncbi:hypothetical protein BDZ97DRAFT_1854086 [Flammula alnicola]|nr:hypothetical protein BDZ97DRAFT_1854086 [Flammula alnicola]
MFASLVMAWRTQGGSVSLATVHISSLGSWNGLSLSVRVPMSLVEPLLSHNYHVLSCNSRGVGRST